MTLPKQEVVVFSVAKQTGRMRLRIWSTTYFSETIARGGIFFLFSDIALGYKLKGAISFSSPSVIFLGVKESKIDVHDQNRSINICICDIVKI